MCLQAWAWPTCPLALDISKAFDLDWRHICLRILHVHSCRGRHMTYGCDCAEFVHMDAGTSAAVEATPEVARNGSDSDGWSVVSDQEA